MCHSTFIISLSHYSFNATGADAVIAIVVVIIRNSLSPLL